MKTRLVPTARRVSPLAAMLAVALASVSVNAASPNANAPQRGDTTYQFVGDEEDPVKGTLFWEGPITGDFEGCIQWWSTDFPATTGQASHYDEIWEIWEGECGADDPELLLTGTETGATTARHFKDSIWRANGVVTGPEGSDLIGRRTHNGGTVEWDLTGEMPAPTKGAGELRVN